MIKRLFKIIVILLLVIVKCHYFFLLCTRKKHAVNLVTIWTFSKVLLTFKRNFQNNLRLVHTTEEVIVIFVATAACVCALIDTLHYFVSQSNQSCQKYEVIRSLGNLRRLVSKKKLFYISGLSFIFSFQVKFVEECPKWNEFLLKEPHVGKFNLKLNWV